MSKAAKSTEPVVYDDEIDLRVLFSLVWSGKWIIAASCMAAALVALGIAFMLPDIYRAEAVLVPNDRDSAGSLSALASQYGGLASLAGVSLERGKVDKTIVGLEILRSRKFISEFIERHAILVPLMAVDEWDPVSGELTIDSAIYDVKSEQWVRPVNPPRKAVPSSSESYDAFRKIMYVNHDTSSGLITVAIEHQSPILAQQWVEWMIADLNASIMSRDVGEAQQAITYLNDQIDRTSIAAMQSVLYGLIEEQTKTMMLAKVSDEYLFKTIDPAVVPEKKFKPRRPLILILGVFIGGIVGLSVVVLIRLVKHRDRG